MQSPRSPLAVLTVMALTWAISGCGDKYSATDNNNENLNNAADCDGGGCVFDKALGEACAAGSECASGNCPTQDGVCCDAACDGECVACVESDTGLADGTCGAVTINTDPDNECGDEGASSCGADGTGCNGDGVAPGCNLYDDTTVCAEQECTAGVTTDLRHCDGTGTCEAAGTTDCAPYGCDAAGGDCLTTCTEPGDCDAASYCDSSGDCVPKQTDGTACDDDDECASSYCVDDVCCNRECDATCEACAASSTGGTDGVCGAVTADTDPDTECTAEGPMTCGADGTGCNGDNVNPGCNLYDNATVCSSTSCSGGMLTSLGWCDGDGTCSAGAPTPCAPYLCNSAGTDCTTSCVSHLECDPGSYCDGTGSCATKLPDGTTCAIGLQCVSGFCPPQDGVCCDSACDTTCESCAAAKTGGTDGECAPVTVDSDPDTECSATAPTTCGANGTGCNGSATNPDCNLYDNTTTCATAGCTGGIQGGDGLCDSLGNCLQSNATPCDPYLCNPGGTACLTTCVSQNDCMTGYFCDGGGVCQPKLADGVACAVDFQCLNGNCPTADGVCCNAPCGGTCEACLAAKTGGADGICGQVTAGTDPDTECAPDVCNGAGSCRCADGLLNGAESAIDCGGGVCAPCAPGQTCNAGTDCTSGNCPSDDGVCCNLPCGGTCEACLAAKTGGTDGTCGPITAGTDPDPDCGADVCNGFGMCRCTDGLLNGAETDTDCGGGVCATCANGQTCLAGTDCTNGNCPPDDLVCCDDGCTSLCESCLASATGSADGTCELVLTNTDPDGDCGASETCDDAGTCYDPCPTVGCFADADCTPAATGDLCVDPANDCLHATCEGATPGTLVESGAPMGEDFATWQSGDDESANGSDRWYCNASLPVTADGVLTTWEVFVDSHYDSGDQAQFMVIRCTAGGGGSAGPVLSGCARVGISPLENITGTGLFTYSLAGSTQEDSAAPDVSGIVVQTGDIICSDTQDFEIGIDCSGSSTTGGCPGPDYDTQILTNLDTATEPFALADSNHDGVLMIKAYGATAGVPGVCSDDTPEPDMSLCTDGGGDTCCGGNCVVGPGGAGTCP